MPVRNAVVFALLLFIALLQCRMVHAQDNPVHRRYAMTRLSDPPRIDGKPDDATWQQLPATQSFTQFQPEPGEPSRFQTEVKAGYTDVALYVIAVMHDTGIISSVLTKRDESGTADYFFIGLDLFNDKQNALRFGVTAAGVQVDMRILPWCLDCIQYDPTWDGVWESEVTRSENGWVAEFKIPYSALRFPSRSEQIWGVQFTRFVSRTQEISTWNPADPKINGVANQWGTLENISGISPPLRLSLSPYLAAYYKRIPLSTNPVTIRERKWISGGMDLKYGISESFTLDMTLIPDFGQVQSDNVVLNLGPFETRYDEKRPFFTEGTELFNKGDLFYSRRVGGTPRLYYELPALLKEGEEIVTNPSQVQLLNATKVSGRTAGGLGIGVFNAVAAPSFATVRDVSTGHTHEIETDVLTNYNLIVLDQTLRHHSSVSLINANTLRRGSSRDANVTALRFNARDKKNRFDLNGTGKVSYVKEHSDSVASVGYAYRIGLSKVSGNFNFDLSHAVTERHFDPNDLGIQFTNNTMSNFASVSYHVFQPKGIYKSYSVALENEFESRITPRRFLYHRANLSGDMTFSNYWYSSLFVQLAPFKTVEVYEPRVPGRVWLSPEFVYVNLYWQSDTRKNLWFSGNIEWAETPVYNDPLHAVSLTPTLRIGNRISLSHQIFLSEDLGNFGFIRSTAFDSVFFGRRLIDRVTNTFSLQYAFNPKASFTLRARHYWTRITYTKNYFLNLDGTLTETPLFASPYNTNFNAVNIDAVFTWQFAAGSFMTLSWKNAVFHIDDESRFNYFDNTRHSWEAPKSHQFSVKVIYYLDYVKVKGWLQK